MSICLIAGIILFFLFGLSHASQHEPTDPNADNNNKVNEHISFLKGYEHFEKKEFLDAASKFFRFLSKNTPNITDYEWAEFFFGICLKKCGLSHAAVDQLSHLVVRRPNLKIMTYCLELFEDLSRNIPFDQDLIINNRSSNNSICARSYMIYLALGCKE